MKIVTWFDRSGARGGSPGALRRTACRLTLAVLAVCAPAAAAAQAGVVGGAVVTGPGGAPVPQAQVRVAGTELSAVTDAGGRFRIAGVTGEQVTLEVRRIGFRPATQTVRNGALDLRITLIEQSVALDEVVVTGTAGSQSRREIPNAVTSVNAAEATERGTVNNIQQLLNARAPGVVVNASSGNVGTGARIRIRGNSSLSLSNEPLIYIDGVRVNSQPATGPINQAFGSSSISRINDINPEDIESIEVIRGPAAATLYGTEASSGVIQIITKKGAVGDARWMFSTRQGVNYIQNPEGRWPVNYQTIQRPGAATGVLDTVSINIMQLERERGTPVFQTGRIQEYDLSTSGGSSLFRYYAGGGIEDSEGVEITNTVRRYSGRLNLQVNPSEQLHLGFNVGYVNGNVSLPCEAGCGGRTWTTISANPQNYVPLADGSPNPRRGFHSGLPEAYDAFYEFYQIVDRFTAGFQLNQQPAGWFRHRVTAGTDRTREENSELGRRIENQLFRTVLGTSGLGYRAMSFRTINNYTFDYSATGEFVVTPAIRSTTSLGAQYYRNYYDVSCAYGEQFPAVGITTVSATTTNRSTCQDVEEDATLGFYVQQQFGWNERLFLIAALRADDNSAFGRNFDRVYYPKLGVSWVVSEEPFWTLPLVDALKLRGAYGEAGKQPITFSALQTYTSATGPGNTPTVTPLSIGNPDLGPERSKELEVGFDLGMLQDRLGAELTYYNRRTVDAILDRTIAPSIGIPGTQPFNAGSIRAWGTELLLRARPVVGDRFEWQTTLGYSVNDNRVEDLGTPFAILELRRQATCAGYVPGTTNPASCPVDDFVLASTGSLPPRHQVGYPVGAYFHKRVVSADYNPDGRVLPTRNAAINVMCDDGKGGSMACANAPFVFLGRSVPRVEGSFSNTITLFGNFSAYALVDFKRDYQKIDGNYRVRCVVNIRCREVFYPQDYDPILIAGVQAGLDVLPDFYINDASYTRLREVSFSYTLPASFTSVGRFNLNRARVSLAGRNLALWTDYTGLDPESFFLGGNRGGSFALFDQTTNPQTTQWVLSFNLDW